MLVGTTDAEIGIWSGQVVISGREQICINVSSRVPCGKFLLMSFILSKRNFLQPSHRNCICFLKSTLNNKCLNSSVLSSSFSVDLLSLCPFSESSATPSVCRKDQVFDFETTAEANCFQLLPVGSGTKTLSSNQKTVKLGQQSLKWHATSNSDSSLQLDFATGHHIAGSWLRRGGIKVWLYRDSASPGKQLKVEFKDTSGTILCLFNASLNFSGWRGIWVKFSECKPSGILFTHPVLSIMSSLP